MDGAHNTLIGNIYTIIIFISSGKGRRKSIANMDGEFGDWGPWRFGPLDLQVHTYMLLSFL